MSRHLPVLPAETLAGLDPRPGMTVVDGTVGLGGHSLRLAEAVGPGGRLIGIDRDPHALALARQALAGAPCPVALVRGAFSDMETVTGLSPGSADRILLDLGVSSLQLDDPARGFSFRADGPLDMRMDPERGLTAAEWIAAASEEEMARVFFLYGEERFSRRVARRIAERRGEVPITSTAALADIVRSAVPRRGRLDPATRVFQALRIAVNDELGELERGLAAARRLLRPGGRLAVISFHSLEDRIVKRAFRDPERTGLRALTKKPTEASEAESESNPRARSAKLRVSEAVERGGGACGSGPSSSSWSCSA